MKRQRREWSAGVVLFRERAGRRPCRPGAAHGKRRRYLLLRNAKGHWDFPKGRREPGETVEETARRETAEESGIRRIELVPGFERRLRWSFPDRGTLVRKVVVYRVARADPGRVRLSREHRRAEWLGFREAVGRLEFPNARRLVLAAERFLAGRAEKRPSARRRS